MKPLEQKAVDLVADERVRIAYDNGEVTVGDVWSFTDMIYHVTIYPGGHICTCKHGQEQPFNKCSHVIALDLARAAAAEKEPATT